MTDLLDMVKGIQQPTRGLFIRFYLLKSMKELLPDQGSEYESEGCDVNDAVNFILKNFQEMNRLWVRLQYLKSKETIVREADRSEL